MRCNFFLGRTYLVPFILDSLQSLLDFFNIGNPKTNSDLISGIRDKYLDIISSIFNFIISFY